MYFCHPIDLFHGLLRRLILSDSLQDFPKTFSLTENKFSGKTYFHTIASREESVYHAENVLSDCTEEGAKCCDGYQNCLDLCDAQADQCVSHDQYASFYVNIKVELAAEKAYEMAAEKMAEMAAEKMCEKAAAAVKACKIIQKVARADMADEGKQAALEACKPLLKAARDKKATNRSSGNNGHSEGRRNTEGFFHN